MPEYGRYCPVSLASDVLADRWTPLIIRELILGNTRFNDITRGLPGISRSLLVQRLRHLERKGVVQLWPSPTGKGNEYHLTPAGRDLERVLDALGRWAVEWQFDELRPHEIDPVTLTWWMHRRVDAQQLPGGRVVVEFDYTAPTRQAVWMVVDHGAPSVCVQHPGFDPDLLVTTTTPALSDVFSGYRTWNASVSAGAISLNGPPGLVKSFPKWFQWSPFVQATKARAARALRASTAP